MTRDSRLWLWAAGGVAVAVAAVVLIFGYNSPPSFPSLSEQSGMTIEGTVAYMCDMRRAWRPTWVSPMSPSSSALGTSAATESTTTTSSAPDRISMSAISSACSPVSGCEINNSSTSTPSAFA